MDALNLWKLQLEQLLSEMAEQTRLEPGTFFVVGCSTSEIAGSRIGTGGALEIGEALFEPLRDFAEKHQLFLAFQGCEHIMDDEVGARLGFRDQPLGLDRRLVLHLVGQLLRGEQRVAEVALAWSRCSARPDFARGEVVAEAVGLAQRRARSRRPFRSGTTPLRHGRSRASRS